MKNWKKLTVCVCAISYFINQWHVNRPAGRR